MLIRIKTAKIKIYNKEKALIKPMTIKEEKDYNA